MKWYNKISSIYDLSLGNYYSKSRQRAIELLDLQHGQSVIDIACGSGANFKYIKAANTKVAVFGTDFSEGMLNKAQAKINKNDWKDITLFQADARHLTGSFIKEQTQYTPPFDRVICVLGLSAIPHWEMVLNKMLGLLKKGGKIVILDVYAEKRTINTWLVEKIAGADLDRKIWQTLKKHTTDFHLEYLDIKERKVGGQLFIAAGFKNL